MTNTDCYKIAYDTADAAEREMHRVLARGTGRTRTHPNSKGAKVSSYKCPVCGAYHWGHYGNKSSPKRKNRRAKS